MDLFAEVRAQYEEFAAYVGHDSDCFRTWAEGVTQDREVVTWISALPRVKRQPNIVFAAARWHGVPAPGPYAGLRAALLADERRGWPVRSTILAHRTQTNEVGRLATLAPVLAHVAAEARRPLALLEVGASAGLCLYPDRYDYGWWPARGAGAGGPVAPDPVRATGSGGPVLHCDVTGTPPWGSWPASVPDDLPVAWRGGIDLNPLDVTDERPDGAMAWLTTLVWPEQEARRARLATAIAMAREDPPTLVRGDLLTELPALVDVAGRHGEVVVFHSAVIAYLEPEDRAVFAVMMAELVAARACRWVSNESPVVLPGVAAALPPDRSPYARFALGLDGVGLAWTHGHGASLSWAGSAVPGVPA